jgi:hypothetical protein
MADFVFFTATAVFRALLSDSDDAGGEPDWGIVTGNVVFTPTIPVVAAQNLTPATTAILNPFTGRIVEDAEIGDTYGVLKTLDEQPLYYRDSEGARTETAEGNTPVYGVRLPANTEALGPLPELVYKVEFTHMKWGGEDRRMDPFFFRAPTEDIEVDLTTVERV